MTTQTTARKSSGCGCGGSSTKTSATPCSCGGKTATTSCSCGGCGRTLCAAPTSGYVRPQFFSGQLLTEDDLRSLVDYVTGKNRLHNRMLFGDGVVCGLKVTIDPCAPAQPCVHQTITVGAGYALDCCGNDIFVPCDVELEFPQLLRDLRARMLGKDCGDPCKNQDTPAPANGANPPTAAQQAAGAALPSVRGVPPNQGPVTQDAYKTYCLYVRYCEQASDPVVPYDSDAPCGMTDCQDTRIREGFRFELRCPPQQPAKSIKTVSNDVWRLHRAEYLQKPVARLQEAYASRDPEDLLDAINQVEQALSLAPVDDDTEVAAQLASARAEARSGASSAQVALRVAAALMRYWRRGSCDVLLPDCAPCDDDAVLIACLSVDGCNVVSVCNTVRRTILSPAYFEFLGLPDLITRVLVAECCGPPKKLQPRGGNQQRDDNLKEWLTSLRSQDPIPAAVAHPAQVDRAMELLTAVAEQRDPGIAEPPTVDDPFSFARYLARTAGVATLQDTGAEDRRVDDLHKTITRQSHTLEQQEAHIAKQQKALDEQQRQIDDLRSEVDKLASGGPAAPRGKKQPPNP